MKTVSNDKVKIQLFDKIEVSKKASHSKLENLGDILITPYRLFFGREYQLTTLSEKQTLKHFETFNTLPRIAAKVAAIVLAPFSILSTLAGYGIKYAAHVRCPELAARYSLSAPEGFTRTEENMAGKLPQNSWFPNCVNSQQKNIWGKLYDVKPISISEKVKEPISVLKSILKSAKIENFNHQNLTLVEEEKNYLHYIYKVVIPTGQFKGVYIDDLDIHYNSSKNHFDIRSASRKGFRDAINLNFNLPGANKKRVEAIRKAWTDMSITTL